MKPYRQVIRPLPLTMRKRYRVPVYLLKSIQAAHPPPSPAHHAEEILEDNAGNAQQGPAAVLELSLDEPGGRGGEGKNGSFDIQIF